MEEEKITMWQLEDELKQVLEDEKEEILDSPYPEDRIHEIVDGVIPIYNYDLLSVAQSNLSLAVDEPEMGGEGAIGQIQGNIYEELSEIANEWLEEQQND